MRSELPGTWLPGSRAGCSWPLFVDHLTIYYRPLGSDAPEQRTFGDRDVARESDLHYRESVLIIPAANRRRL
ncbi:hypothetical protein LNP25_29835 [Klebsiella variicola subsp. variicola]|nr:hypothetical protein [Klebsiella variicola subsp. variicola]